MVDGQVVFTTSDDWGTVPAGAIAAVPVAELEAGRATPKLVFQPTPRQAVDGSPPHATRWSSPIWTMSVAAWRC